MPPVRRLHPADPVGAGVGEGALHMAEQLAFEQILGDRAEIDRDQHLVGAARAAVQLARDQLLAGAVLAEDQDVGVGRPGALDQRPDPRHRRRVAEQGRLAAGAGAAIASTLLALGHHLGARGAQGGGGADGGEQPLVRPGLGDEIGGAALHRLDRDADPGMGGDHHHHRLRIALQDLAEPVEALGGVGRAAAEIGVEQDRRRAARCSIAASASSGAWKAATSANRSRSSSRADRRMSGSSSMMMQRPKRFVWLTSSPPVIVSDNGQSISVPAVRSPRQAPVCRHGHGAARRMVAGRIGGNPPFSARWHGSC